MEQTQALLINFNEAIISSFSVSQNN